MNTRFFRYCVMVLAILFLGGVFTFFNAGAENPDSRNLENTVNNAGPQTSSALHGDFNLVSENGEDVTETNWPETYNLVFFGFTHCPDVCPATLEKISLALEDAGTVADRVTPLFITVDPERDKPADMKEYTDLYDSRIIGLTGSRAQVDKAIDAYKVYASRAPAKKSADDKDHNMKAHGKMRHEDMYLMQHSSYIYIMSPQGDLAKIISSDSSVEEMRHAIVDAVKD